MMANMSTEDMPEDSSNNGTVEAYPAARFYTNGLLAGIFILSGILSNVVVITAWLLDRGRWLALYYYFLAFASWNLMLLLSTLFFYSLPALLRQSAQQSTVECVPYFYVIGYAGANCCLTAVVWLMVVLTVERYIAVTRPFHTRISSPRRRAKMISVTLSVAALLYNIPLIFELEINHTVYQYWNETDIRPLQEFNVWAVNTAPFRSNVYYQSVYRVTAHLMFISLVPFLIILLLTLRIVYVVSSTNRARSYYKRTDARKSLTPGSNGGAVNGPQSRSSITSTASYAASYGNVLLTVFVVKFLICYTLPLALNVSELLLPQYVFATNEMMWVTDVSDFLVIMDSVSNAFLYISWRKRIRFYKKRKDPSGQSFSKEHGVDGNRKNSTASTCGSHGSRTPQVCYSYSPRSSERRPLRAQQKDVKGDESNTMLLTMYGDNL